MDTGSSPELQHSDSSHSHHTLENLIADSDQFEIITLTESRGQMPSLPSNVAIPEPLVAESPTSLSIVPPQSAFDDSLEPISSGFTSLTGVENGPDSEHSADFASSPSIGHINPTTELADEQEDDEGEVVDESPIVEHLKRKPIAIHRSERDLEHLSDTIFLSRTAEAAARFARVKRNLLKQPSETSRSFATQPRPHRISRASHPRLVSRVTVAGSPIPSLRHNDIVPDDDGSCTPEALFQPDERTRLRCLIRQSHCVDRREQSSSKRQYGQDEYGRAGQSAANPYPFSTAAAKLSGASGTSDSRIRDAYRTETLTSVVQPILRYKKAIVVPTLSIPVHHSTSLVRPRRLPDFQVGAQITIRSSPIRPSDQFSIHSEDSQDEESTRVALRTSLFGSNTPECLQGEREGIRELSPNVSLWRKGMRLDPRRNKKRRPSYWDDDLEAVRMSPASRAGIVSWPAVSSRNIAAEVDEVVAGADSVVLDEDNLLAEVEDAGVEFERRMCEQTSADIEMSDVANTATT